MGFYRGTSVGIYSLYGWWSNMNFDKAWEIHVFEFGVRTIWKVLALTGRIMEVETILFELRVVPGQNCDFDLAEGVEDTTQAWKKLTTSVLRYRSYGVFFKLTH